MKDVTILGSKQWPPTPERPWRTRVTFGVAEGRPVVVSVEVYAVEPQAIINQLGIDASKWVSDVPRISGANSSPISSTGLRLPLGELLAEYLTAAKQQAALRAAHRRARASVGASSSGRVKPQEAATSATRLGRPVRYDRKHYEAVAAVYLRALAQGQAPTEAVKDHFGVGKSAATKWVATARERGLLPFTVKGRAAGWPSRTKKEGRQ